MTGMSLHPAEADDLVRRLRASASRLGLTERNVAVIVGVSNQTVNVWFSGKVRPAALSTGQAVESAIKLMDGVHDSTLPVLAKRNSRHQWAVSAGQRLHGDAG